MRPRPACPCALAVAASVRASYDLRLYPQPHRGRETQTARTWGRVLAFEALRGGVKSFSFEMVHPCLDRCAWGVSLSVCDVSQWVCVWADPAPFSVKIIPAPGPDPQSAHTTHSRNRHDQPPDQPSGATGQHRTQGQTDAHHDSPEGYQGQRMTHSCRDFRLRYVYIAIPACDIVSIVRRPFPVALPRKLAYFKKFVLTPGDPLVGW